MSPLPAFNLGPILDQRGRDADELWKQMRATIENAITHQPRSLQRRIGPSEIGIPCQRCLAHKLHGTPTLPQPAAWLPYIGTAVHEQLANVFMAANDTHRAQPGCAEQTRWLCEMRVAVGDIGGVEITGSADLFDRATATVIDFKIVGASTLQKAKAHGPSDTYRAQVNLYGRGFTRRGLPVDRVAIAYLPRNAVSLAQGYFWSDTYDEQIALAALARANGIADNLTLLTQLGADIPAYIASLPTAADCWSCSSYLNPDGTRPPVPGRGPDPLTALIAG